jgi:oxygen-independent coproporphyrinogen-3 oxidase
MLAVPVRAEVKDPGEAFLANLTSDPLGLAFDRKFAVHAGSMGGGGATYGGEKAAKAFEAALGAWRPEPLAVYLHIPFCLNRCLYCGFGGHPPSPGILPAYTEALIREIEWLTARTDKPVGPVVSIFFGGGTPTLLGAGDLGKITEALSRRFDLANDCEITLEGRAGDLTPEKVDGCLAAGINRVSIGVQTFDTAVRRSLGRLSDRGEAVSRLEGLIARRKAAVIIDLIYGLPGQDLSKFLSDMQTAVSVGVDGLDVYQLNTFPGGPLEQAVREGRLEPPTPLRSQGQYYLLAAEYFTQLKWRQLSLTHYASGTRERNLYNPWAKSRKHCLGLGAGAGGYLGGYSFYRRPKPEAYIKAAAEGRPWPDLASPLAEGEALTSLIIEQMEQGYLDLELISSGFKLHHGPLGRLVDNWRKAGLVELDRLQLRLTPAGRFWGVNLTQALVEAAPLAAAS